MAQYYGTSQTPRYENPSLHGSASTSNIPTLCAYAGSYTPNWYHASYRQGQFANPSATYNHQQPYQTMYNQCPDNISPPLTSQSTTYPGFPTPINAPLSGFHSSTAFTSTTSQSSHPSASSQPGRLMTSPSTPVLNTFSRDQTYLQSTLSSSANALSRELSSGQMFSRPSSDPYGSRDHYMTFYSTPSTYPALYAQPQPRSIPAPTTAHLSTRIPVLYPSSTAQPTNPALALLHASYHTLPGTHSTTNSPRTTPALPQRKSSFPTIPQIPIAAHDQAPAPPALPPAPAPFALLPPPAPQPTPPAPDASQGGSARPPVRDAVRLPYKPPSSSRPVSRNVSGASSNGLSCEMTPHRPGHVLSAPAPPPVKPLKAPPTVMAKVINLEKLFLPRAFIMFDGACNFEERFERAISRPPSPPPPTVPKDSLLIDVARADSGFEAACELPGRRSPTKPKPAGILTDGEPAAGEAGWQKDTSLCQAAEDMDLARVMKLLEDQTADVNVMMVDRSVLYLACRNGWKEVVEILLKREAKVDVERHNWCTPLYIAAQNGFLPIVELLLAHKANPNWDKQPDGLIPLHYAAQNGHLEVVKALIEADSEVNKASPRFGTPLHFAAAYGRLEVVKELCDKKADVTKTEKNGLTALFIAAMMDFPKVVEQLSYVGPATVDYQCEPSKMSALAIAADRGHSNVVKALLELKGNVNIPDAHGNTPLTLALLGNRSSVVQLLLQHNADPRQEHKDGMTPLTLAHGMTTDAAHALVSYRHSPVSR